MRASAAIALALLAVGALGADLEQLVAEHFRVRVRIGSPRAHQTLLPTGPCVLLNFNDEITRRIEGGQRLLVDLSERAVAPPVWRIRLGEFDRRRKTAARALAARVGDAVNFPAEVLELTEIGEDGEEVVTRLLVTLGQFETREEAEAHLTGVLPARSTASLWHDERGREIARLRVRDEDGTVLGEFWEGFSVVPIDASTVTGAIRNDEERVYHGRLICRGDTDGRILVINEVHVEDYLPSVVAREIGSDAPPEALRAQAIVARSEALYKVDSVHHPTALYDLCDTTHCQDYRGLSDETPGSRLAVRTTRGLVLMHDGQVCNAVYSHSCGGVTAPMEDVWRSEGVPYAQGRLDAPVAVDGPDLSSEGATWSFLMDPPPVMGDPSRTDDFPRYARGNFRWSTRMTADELRRCYTENVGRIRDVRVAERGRSGRVIRLEIVGEHGVVDLRKSTQITTTLGPSVRSTLFVIDAEHDEEGFLEMARFVGGGWGHGVGLCQMGAYVRGLEGQGHREIIEAYFPRADLRRVY